MKNITGFYVACEEKRRDAYRVRWEDLKERYHLENQGVDGRVILKKLKNRLRGSGLD
jgi:hypothetical protein